MLFLLLILFLIIHDFFPWRDCSPILNICITFFSCLNRRNIIYERSISIKQLWLEIIEKIGCSKSDQPSTVIIYIYIYIMDWLWAPFFSIISSQRCFIELVFLQKKLFLLGNKKVLYIQNWWTIPLLTRKQSVQF